MGEDCGTWIPQLHFDWQSHNLSSFGAPLDVGKQNCTSAVMNPCVDMVTRNEPLPAYVPSAQPHLQLAHSNEPHGWFYCLPRFRQGFMPAPNSTAQEKLPAGHVKGFKEEIAPNGESVFPQKQFLVIDQTGDQTTLIYSSRFGSPVEFLASRDSKLHGSNDLNGNEPSLKRDLNRVVGPTLNDKVDENQGNDIESEMHEDTEEINALLYSDSDGYSTEDDEVTSTGHSPSIMTTHDNQEPLKGTAEEVASSAGKTKKRKLFDGAYDDDTHLMDTASSLNLSRPFDMGGDDAESRCSSGNYSQGYKKMRKEKIHDVLSILQCIVPGGKGKDAIELLDEAIRCLKSLKLKARALGLDAL
ncbi:transcription factor bHLH143-like [Gastrolobium bilobum]|uniref:transcription factor bHLH143-like n=1 Tax=Gastrolobium bilobum TaxID=150636 RepID=UPI002AB1F120|nr:transcription factor bHLH143-like [Gastrolobium bilobum]XP_061362355.1 transcription factor bHLH143-like [Gastrolobium bilobum]XP_061362356.1 transcription factor bHLH143-like [Gastrolobium bilobum]